MGGGGFGEWWGGDLLVGDGLEGVWVGLASLVLGVLVQAVRRRKRLLSSVIFPEDRSKGQVKQLPH